MLELDSSVCAEARMSLTNPRKRLSAEISWFPGMSVRQINTVIKEISNQELQPETMKKLSSLAGFNAILYYLESGAKISGKELESVLFALAQNYDTIKPEQILTIINEDRSVSGFPEITELSLIQEEILSIKNNAIRVIQDAVSKLTFDRLNKVMLNLMEKAVKDSMPLMLLDDIIDEVYAMAVQKNIDTIESDIKDSIQHIRSSYALGQTKLKAMVDEFLLKLEKFDNIMQPIQLSTQRRGLEHKLTRDIAYEVRRLSIFLSDNGYIELDRQITKKMNELFVEVGSIEELTAKDLKDIDEISKKKAAEKKEIGPKNEDIECEFTHTDFFGNETKLAISKKGITYGDKTYKLKDITRVRYGAKWDSGSLCTLVAFGTKDEETQIKWLESGRGSGNYPYDEFIECLWHAVGFDIMMAMLNQLALGHSIYGVIYDDKVKLERESYYGDDYVSGDSKFFKWSDVGVSSNVEELTIAARSDPKYKLTLPLRLVENASVLSVLLKVFIRETRGFGSISEHFQVTPDAAKKANTMKFPNSFQYHSAPSYNVGRKVLRFIGATWWIWFFLLMALFAD